MRDAAKDDVTTTQEGARGKLLPAMLLAGLSLLWPGAGQVYAGAVRLGVVLFATTTALTIIARVLSEYFSPAPGNYALVAALLAISFATGLFSAVHAGVRIFSGHRRSRQAALYASTWGIFVAFLLSQIVTTAVFPTGWKTFFIPSASGVPNLLPGDRLFVSTGSRVMAGSIVVFRAPGAPNLVYIKRVVGMPGDTVQMSGGRLYINNAAIPRQFLGIYPDNSDGNNVLTKLYRETLPDGAAYQIIKRTDDGPANNTQIFTVPAGDLFVLGDNRDNSLDSRFMDGKVGFVPVADVIGEAALVFWPPGRFGAIK